MYSDRVLFSYTSPFIQNNFDITEYDLVRHLKPITIPSSYSLFCNSSYANTFFSRIVSIGRRCDAKRQSCQFLHELPSLHLHRRSAQHPRHPHRRCPLRPFPHSPTRPFPRGTHKDHSQPIIAPILHVFHIPISAAIPST